MSTEPRTRLVVHDLALVRIPLLTQRVFFEAAWPSDDEKRTESPLDFFRNETPFRNAIFLGSSSLFAQLTEATISDGARSALRRYLARASTRATPFGALAGVAIAELGPNGVLDTGVAGERRVHVALSSLHAHRLARRLVLEGLETGVGRFRVNETANLQGSIVRYHRASPPHARHSHSAAAAPTNVLIEALLPQRGKSLRWPELMALAAEAAPESAVDELKGALRELIEEELLLAEAEPAILGTAYHVQLVELLRDSGLSPAWGHEVQGLSSLLESPRQLTDPSLQTWWNAAMGLVDDITTRTNDTAPSVDSGTGARAEGRASRDFQVLSSAPASGALNQQLARTCISTIAELGALWSHPHQQRAALARAIDAFAPTSGVPMRQIVTLFAPMADATLGENLRDPALDGLANDRPKRSAQDKKPALRANPLTSWLDGLCARAGAEGRERVELSAADIAALEAQVGQQPSALSIEAHCELVRVDQRDSLLLRSATNSVGRLSGRFLGLAGSRALYSSVRATWERIEQDQPDVIFAELTVSSPTLFGDIATHPPILPHQILLHGRPSVPEENVLTLDELVVRSIGGNLQLWSQRRQRRVEPLKFHAVDNSFLDPTARVLLSLGTHHRSWGLYGEYDGAFDVVPRIERQGVILSPRMWRVSFSLSETLRVASPKTRSTLLKRWVEAMALPRFVGIGLEDPLYVDTTCEEGLVELARAATVTGTLWLREMFEAAGVVKSGHDAMAAEAVFYGSVTSRAPAAKAALAPPTIEDNAPELLDVTQRWLYLKLYAPASAHEELIARLVPELVLHEGLQARVQNFHFVRYADDAGPHLRLRIELETLSGLEALEHLAPHLTEEVASGRLAGWTVDLFRPEYLRYGGERAWRALQTVFSADSRLAVAIAQRRCEGELPSVVVPALKVIHLLLRPVCETLEERVRLLERLRQDYEEELGETDSAFREAVGRAYLPLKLELERAVAEVEEGLVAGALPEEPFNLRDFYFEVATAMQKAKAELTANPGILTSVIHMFCNRLLGTREREGVLYGYAHRASLSVLKRRTAQRRDQ